MIYTKGSFLRTGAFFALLICILNAQSASATNRRPIAPSNLRVSDSGGRALLKWRDKSNNEGSFVINRTRRQSNGRYGRSTNIVVAANTTSRLDNPGRGSYRYKIKARNSAGSSAFTSIVSITLTSTPNAAPTPTLTPTPTPTPQNAAVYVIPAANFAGVTAQPAATGSGFASTSKAIAHWDTVPYQTFSDTMNVAVVAFHANSIEKVSFSVNGGEWVSVTQMTTNPETNVVEYWATLRASDFPADGPIEVRAIAYPKIGVPSVLQGMSASTPTSSLILNVNRHGTLPRVVRYVSSTGNDANACDSLAAACRTISRAVELASTAGLGSYVDGVEIRLDAGSWQLPVLTGASWWLPGYYNTNRWLTITSAPEVDSSQVVITGYEGAADSSGLGIKLVRLANLTITEAMDRTSGDTFEDYLWFDHVSFHRDLNALYQGGSNCRPFQGYGGIWSGTFLTDVYMDLVCDGPRDAMLARNVFAERSGGGHASGTSTVINYSVKTIFGSGYPFPQGTGPDYHGDYYQMYGRSEDIILYGITTVPGGFINSRGIVGGRAATKDVAIVDANPKVANTGVWPFSFCASSDIGFTIDHMVIKNSTFQGPSDWCLESSATPTADAFSNVQIENSTFINGHPENLPYPLGIPGIRVQWTQ